MSNFSIKLRELRKEKGLSQVDLVRELNGKIPKTAICYWENNQRVPSLDAVIILAKYFGVSLDYLAGL